MLLQVVRLDGSVGRGDDVRRDLIHVAPVSAATVHSVEHHAWPHCVERRIDVLIRGHGERVCAVRRESRGRSADRFAPPSRGSVRVAELVIRDVGFVSSLADLLREQVAFVIILIVNHVISLLVTHWAIPVISFGDAAHRRQVDNLVLPFTDNIDISIVDTGLQARVLIRLGNVQRNGRAT